MTMNKSSTAGAKYLHRLLGEEETTTTVTRRTLNVQQMVIFETAKTMLAWGETIERVEKWVKTEVAKGGL